MIARSLHFKCATTDLEAENDHRASVQTMSDNILLKLFMSNLYLALFPVIVTYVLWGKKNRHMHEVLNRGRKKSVE